MASLMRGSTVSLTLNEARCKNLVVKVGVRLQLRGILLCLVELRNTVARCPTRFLDEKKEGNKQLPVTFA